MNPRRFLFGFLLAGLSVGAAAQGYPAKSIRLLIGFAPGGAADYVARAMSQSMSTALGQSVVVENRPGAGSSIAADLVAKAAPDGYTLLIASPSSISVNPALNPKLGYSPRDLAPVTKLTSSPLVIAANPNTGINSVQDLVARAKKEPGKLNYATVNTGSTQHLVSEWFKQLGGFQAQGLTFRTTPEVITSVLRGDVSYAIELAHAVRGQVESGELKILAVTTPTRWPSLPDTPTAVEQGLPTFAATGWYGLVYPAGVPQPIIDKTQKALTQVLAQDAIKRQLANAGAIPALSTPAEFNKLISDEVVRWKKVATEAHIQPQ